MFRSFRVIQELRANGDPETGHLARKRRNRKNLPNSWDDCPRSRVGNKNWKEYRKRKYREKNERKG